MDMATTLIILAANGGDSNGKSATLNVLSIWLRTPEMFPFHHMETIINRRKENEVSSTNNLTIWTEVFTLQSVVLRRVSYTVSVYIYVCVCVFVCVCIIKTGILMYE